MSNKKVYIINFDRNDEAVFNYKEFHTSLTTAKGIDTWCHYLKSSYIIITPINISAEGVYSFLEKVAPEKSFFVCELALKNHFGRLNPKAWEWFDKVLKEI